MGSSFGFRRTREFVLNRISLNYTDIIHCFSFSHTRRTRRANSARDFADRQKVLLGFTEKKRLFIAQMEAEEEFVVYE